MNMTFDEFEQRESDTMRATTKPLMGQRGWDWCSLGAVFGLSAGVIAVTIGSLLTVASWLQGGAGGSYTKIIGTVLLVLTIPLLIFGAHCLDLMERRKEREREKRFSDRE